MEADYVTGVFPLLAVAEPDAHALEVVLRGAEARPQGREGRERRLKL